jgi:arylsulfatase A-like enzyme
MEIFYPLKQKPMKHIMWCMVLLVALFSCKKEESRPNIIFIMTDDHATSAISAYGSPYIETPNLDQLAKEGILFKKAFVTNSICAPSRAVILTGKYSHLNSVPDNETAFDTVQLTFPKVFQKNGYQTAIVGKWHLRSQPKGFDYWNVLPGQGLYYNPAFIDNGKDTTYQGYVTDIITDKTLEWLQQRDANKPFMLMMHHKAPHRNWMPALRHLDQFEEGFSTLPESYYDQYSGREHLKDQTLTVAEHMSLGYDLKMKCDTCTEAPINQWTSNAFQHRMNLFTEEQREQWVKGYQQERSEFESFERHDTRAFKEWKLKRYLQDYLRCILSVDESIGRINQFLKESGLDENTLVVYTSDQGFFLGEHGLFDKRYMYEESFSTPMIMKYPEMIPPGSTSDELVMNLDLAPTFLDLAAIEIPNEMQGRSLLPVMSSKAKTQWRESIYYHFYEDAFGVPRHYGVRTDRYKLIRFDTDPVSWEMYDLENDPKEMTNLYNDPEYASVQEMLKEEMEKLREKYKITED